MLKKYLLVIVFITLSSILYSKGDAKMNKTIYDFSVKNIDGKEILLSEFKNKVILIVNVASKCGFTKQYKELQELYEKYKDNGFVILGFPCNQFASQEPGTSQEIKEFCSINYGVNFPLFEKIDVNGDNAHPLYKFLKSAQSGFLSEAIKWNFTKFIVNKKGEVIDRYAPSTSPSSIEDDIKKLINE